MRTHPDIFDCYAFGVEDKRMGEEVCVWIKLKSGVDKSKLTSDDIKAFCKGNIAQFKIPRYIKFVDSFPINATGKVQKFKMTAQMNAELSAQPNAS